MLGCDIDGCLLNIVTLLKRSIHERCGAVFKIEEIRSYEIEKCFNIPKDVVKAAVREVVTNIDVKPCKGAVRCLADYSNTTKNKLVFITTRPKYSEASTRYILDHLFRVEYDLYLTDDKVPIINDCGISIFIEDRARNAKHIAENTSCQVLLYDRPWNKHLDISPYPLITRVNGWKMIREIINKRWSNNGCIN